MEIKLSELVDKVVGTYSTHGQHEYDMESLEHLEAIDELLDHLVQRLCGNAKDGNGSSADSVIQVGKRSLQILNGIQCMIEDTKYDIRESK